MPRRAVQKHIARAGLWSALAFFMSLIWEIAHARLYSLWIEVDALGVALALFHCTLGDVVIALVAFFLTGIVLQHGNWPLSHPKSGGAMVVIGTITYTVWSEWYNVYRAGSWGYTELMPTIFGIGLSPLLQWLILPIAMVIAYRKLSQQTIDENAMP